MFLLPYLVCIKCILNALYVTVQLGVFFTFLARQMACPNNGVSVDSRLFESVLESLCNAPLTADGDDATALSHHEERQQALLELLSHRALDHFGEDRLVSLSNAAGFFQVSEMLYGRRRQFHRILNCYVLDDARQNLVFAYVKQTITSPDISLEEKKKVREAVLEQLEDLICIDAKKAAKLITTNMSIDLAGAVDRVVRCRNEEAAFRFLHLLLDMTDSRSGDGSSDEDRQFDSAVYERYVELLCQRAMTEEVVAFLQSRSGYRTTNMLKICRQYRVSAAVVVLLEKSGDLSGAFEVAFRVLRSKLSCVVRVDGLGEDQCGRLKAVRDGVEGIISLLNRHSPRLDRAEFGQLWFTLFDLLIDSYNRLFGRTFDNGGRDGGSTSVGDEYRSILQHTVSCMVSYIPFTAVLDHVVTSGEDRNGIGSCFGNVRHVLSSVMDECRYQKTLHTTCARIVHKDVNGALGGLTVAARAPISPRCHWCPACQRAPSETGKSDNEVDVVCFQCGHAFHRACLGDSVGILDDTGEAGSPMDRPWHCTICCRSRTRFTEPFSRSRVVGVSRPLTCEDDYATSQPVMCSTTVKSVDRLRRSQSSVSRFEVLAELRRLEEVKTVRSSNVWNNSDTAIGNGSVFHDDKFRLKLAPPPAQ